MIATILVITLGLSEAALWHFVINRRLSSESRGSSINVERRRQELSQKEDFENQLLSLYSQLVEFDSLAERVLEMQEIQDSLRAERGRSAITKAELETLEARLRELIEIERELEASGLETKEELKILSKKEKDLAQKNSNLKEQLINSAKEFDDLLKELEISGQLRIQVDKMKSEMLMTQEKCDQLFIQIEEGNKQYFILKQRYDALDIEYAQLYEKFSEENPGAAD